MWWLPSRVFMDDTAEDNAAIQPVLSQVDFYPLSKFDGKIKTTDWSKLPHFPGPKARGNGRLSGSIRRPTSTSCPES